MRRIVATGFDPPNQQRPIALYLRLWSDGESQCSRDGKRWVSAIQAGIETPEETIARWREYGILDAETRA